ncbi:MAG: hypothetical protein PHI98_02520 [Eubacteriales bacterium]|nr:hypothetical protein [Eubacteriales bacterium]
MSNLIDGPEMPLGLGMALGQNLQAMNRFANMTPEEQQAVIAHTHSIASKEEMQAYVQSLLQ